MSRHLINRVISTIKNFLILNKTFKQLYYKKIMHKG